MKKRNSKTLILFTKNQIKPNLHELIVLKYRIHQKCKLYNKSTMQDSSVMLDDVSLLLLKPTSCNLKFIHRNLKAIYHKTANPQEQEIKNVSY